MMGVCKSWNDQICGLNGLFADIAFDTTDHVTISTAAKFLQIVETRSSNLRVYARCITWDGSQAQKDFFSRLRLQSWRFVCFEVEHTSPSFIAYFNLSAPGLLRLVHTSPLPERLFASSFTNLRILDTSVEKNFPRPTTLANLVTLRLKNSDSTRHFCATSLLDLIGSARHLEELQLTGFTRFTDGSETRRLICANLKSIRLARCNLKFILQHLQFPNANSFDVESYGIGSTGQLDLPHFGDTDYFSPLRACPVPILDQHPLTEVTVHMQDLLVNHTYFRLGLKCGTSRAVDFTIAFRQSDSWEAYFQSSMNEILQRIRLCAAVDLSLFHYLPSPFGTPSRPPSLREAPLSFIDSAFFRLTQVVVLRTDCSLLRDITLRLADSEHVILPNLKCYSFDAETLLTPMDVVVPDTVACLRSRFIAGSPFAIQYWTLDDTGEV